MRVDVHCHIVGSGSSGSGCWLKLRGLHRWLAKLMLSHIGLTRKALDDDFDMLYVNHLVGLIRRSSIDRAIILANENPYDEKGQLIDGVSNCYVPNDYVLTLAEEFEEFLPGVAIHPGRNDALKELDRCITAGAVLVKLLPNCQNIDCSEPRYEPFWRRMAEAGLPLLAHTGGEHTMPVIRKEYADPRTLELPLRCGVNVIAAHSGTRSGLFDKNYTNVLIDMMGEFDNLYADNSALNLPFRSKYYYQCLDKPLVKRMIYGSDFPVPVYGLFPFLRGYIEWNVYRRYRSQRNVIERDYQLKSAMGFPEETLTRIWSLLPQAAVEKELKQTNG